MTAGYPLMLTNLGLVRCIVVGGGSVAERKVRDLIAGGAQPIIISPRLTEALTSWREAGQVEHIERNYIEGDLRGAFLVIAATNDRKVNAAVAAAGARLGILVNIADEPLEGNFHTVATVRRGDLVLSVSTSGASPALTARIRRELEAQYGNEYAALLVLLRTWRSGAARSLPQEQRRKLWRLLTSDDVLEWLRAGQLERVEAYAQEQIARLLG